MFSSKFNLYKFGWLELVFENRNKAYGAYELRQHNNHRTVKSLVFGVLLFLAFFGVAFLTMNRSVEMMKVYELPAMKDPVIIPDVKKNEPPKPVAKAKPQPRLASKKFTTFKPVPDEQVPADPPTIKELEQVQIGKADVEGEKSSPISEIPAKDESGATGGGTDPNAVRTAGTVDKMPEFTGGFEAWAKFLRKNLRYPSTAVENQVTGRVVLSFVVERNGSISDVKIVKGIGYGCDEEALRVIKKAPAWSPGIQAGKPVRVQYTIPIAFQLY